MSLLKAQPLDMPLPQLPVGPPFKCDSLSQWVGVPFWLEPTDNRLKAIHQGNPAPSPALENLEGMVHYWIEHPEWMNMLDPDSPVFQDKYLERLLYQNFWGKHLKASSRVLDIGAGVGRMTQWALDKSCEVQAIDPDLRSLWRLLSHVSDKPGYIDIHWSTAEKMPDLGTFDVAIACEVLNYVESPEQCISRIYSALKPGGKLLISVEARWGWALSNDVAEGTLNAFLNDGIVHVPNDRWIRTYTEEQLRHLLKQFNIIALQPSHYSLSGPFENIVGHPSPSQLIQVEEQLRNHPIVKNLNRAWMVVAQK